MMAWVFRSANSAADVGPNGIGEALETPPSESSDKTPGIALSLGGGVARGWAHIGVLRALDEANINISMIAGTSIGALAGACYLAGKLDELEEFARTLTPRRVFSLLDFGLRKSGIISGDRLANAMKVHLDGIKIEDLPKSLITVATEVKTGHEVWIDRGDLVTAVRASYALPGVFEPVVCNGRVLMDGAIVNPVPVSPCRMLEHRYVVAVDLHHDCFGRSALVRHDASSLQSTESDVAKDADLSSSDLHQLGIAGAVIEAFHITQDRITRTRLAGDPPDLTIRPEVADIGLTEFHRADEAIKMGYQAAVRCIEELSHIQTLNQHSYIT